MVGRCGFLTVLHDMGPLLLFSPQDEELAPMSVDEPPTPNGLDVEAFSV